MDGLAIQSDKQDRISPARRLLLTSQAAHEAVSQAFIKTLSPIQHFSEIQDIHAYIQKQTNLPMADIPYIHGIYKFQQDFLTGDSVIIEAYCLGGLDRLGVTEQENHWVYKGPELVQPCHPHRLQSISKAVIATGFMIAFEKSKYFEKGVKIKDQLKRHTLKTLAFPGIQERHHNITLFDLLTMTSGICWENNVDSQNLHCGEDYICKVLAKEVGEKSFKYKDADSIILAELIPIITGHEELSVEELLNNLLFDQLKIPASRVNWTKHNISGKIGASGGLSLCPNDLARVAMLWQNKGSSKGKSILSKKSTEFLTHMHHEFTKKDVQNNPASTSLVQNFQGYAAGAWIDQKNQINFKGIGGNTVVLQGDTCLIITAGGYNTTTPDFYKQISTLKQYLGY